MRHGHRLPGRCSLSSGRGLARCLPCDAASGCQARWNLVYWLHEMTEPRLRLLAELAMWRGAGTQAWG
eukprot:37274-Alexandrium_andersonii.AAC.1